MIYENNNRLREYLDRGAAGAYREHLRHPRFEFDETAFAAALDLVRAQFPDLAEGDAQARAAFRLLTSGVAPEVAVPLPSRWFRCRRFLRDASISSWPWLKLAWAVAVLLLSATAVLLLSALAARAEPTPANMQAIRNATRGMNLLPQQPGGLILQFQQAGSVLATRPAGLVAFNCSTGMSCSFSGATFTLTSTGGGGGSGCVPSGSTASALLYDTGSGACDDVAKITWNNGTSTLLGVSGLNADFSAASTFKFKFGASSTITNTGGTGQALLSNGDGTASFADPIVSGPDARGAAQTRNPVAGLAGIDYGAGCGGGPCVQEGKVDSSGNLYIGNFPSGFNVNNTPSVAQSGTWTVQPGNTANTTAWLVTGTGGTFPATQSGNWTARIVGNAGGAMDAAGQNASSPANALVVACQFNTTPTTITSGNVSPEQCDSKGSRNVDQQTIAGTAVDVNSGNKSAGTQRNVLATDSPAIANWGQGATGSAVPSGAQYQAGNGTGNLTGYLNCDNTAVYDASTNGSTQLVALTSNQTIYVCGYQFSTSSSSAVSVNLRYGTGSNCATSPSNITPSYPLQAATSTGPIGLVVMTPGFTGLKTAASNALCINTNAAVSVQGIVWYTKF